jgi:excinuclease UvrABC nuclease subunit
MIPFKLNFEGYWREVNKMSVPNLSGLYCVYSCTFNDQTKTVKIHQLLYIGEAKDVNSRITNHERLNDWKSNLESNMVLCYSFAHISNESDRKKLEAGLIFKHKPPLNAEYTLNYPFEPINIISEGKTALLNKNFTL